VITSQLTKVIRIEHDVRIFASDKPSDIAIAMGKVAGILAECDIDGSDGNKDYVSLKFIEEKKVVE
jgi:hypothetical protein